MTNALAHKTINYKNFNLHFLYFKQIDVDELEQLCDSVYEQQFQSKIEIINCKIIIPKPHIKKFNKSLKKVFAEVNWMIDELVADKNEKISGVFIGISNCTVKTLLVSKKVIKLLEVGKSKIALIAADKTSFESNNSFEDTQFYTGLTKDNFVLNFNDANAFDKDIVLLSDYCDFNGINDKSSVETIFIKDSDFTYLNVKSIKEKDSSDFSAYMKSILDAIESQIKSRNFEWNNLVNALFVIENKEQLKQLKTLFKENKIPLSGILFYKPENNDGLFSFEMNFTHGTKG